MAADVLELAQALIRLDTINPPGNEAQATDLLGERLEAAGFDVQAHGFGEGRANLVARLAGTGDGAPLCLTGHVDTVPLGLAEWTRDAHAAEVDGDKLYGRGASDMKGGVAAFVVAAERVAALGRGERGLELVILAGEETGCDGARALAEMPDALGRAGAVLVAEPTSNFPYLAHKGALWLRATATGRTAHGSMPHLGENAVYKLARAIGLLEQFAFGAAPHELLGEPTLSVGTITGGININSVPDRASAGIDIRTVPGMTSDEVLARLGEVLGDEIALERVIDVPAVATAGDDPWAREVFEVMAPLIDDAPEPRGINYFTDASVLTPAYGGPPTVVCGPGEPGQAHGTDEWCSVARLEASAQGIFEVAQRWCRM